MKRPILLIALVVVLLAGGAAWYFLLGPGSTISLEEARQKFGAQYDEKRAQFKKIADLLPRGPIAGNSPAVSLDPKPVYDVQAKEFNTEIIMHAQLLDPDVELRTNLDPDLLLFEGNLRTYIQMLGPKSKLQVPLEKKAIRDFERALEHRYLVVLRPNSYVAPRMIDDRTYSTGMLDLDGFVVDLSNNQLKTAFRIAARTASSTTAVSRDGKITREEVESSAYSTLWTDARKKVKAALTELTGGKFVFEHYD